MQHLRPLLPRHRRSERKGIVLIVVIGVLTVLAALVAGFFVLTRTQAKSALHFSDSTRARFMADAGVNDAISRLRAQAFQKAEDPSDAWCTVDYLNNKKSQVSFAATDPANPNVKLSYTAAMSNTAGPNSDRYTLSVEDAASKININACDNLGVLLDNLCRAIGPPLAPADQDKITPRVWEWYGATASAHPCTDDWPKGGSPNTAPYGEVPEDVYYELDNNSRPAQNPDGTAVFGDGYAIAGYRSRHGLYQNIEDVKSALTVVSRPGHPELETLEREVKFQALKPYITVDSWIDTNTVCVGKFEWISHKGNLVHAIDRDKSWVADDPVNDPLNHRGSLRGCYLSFISGHGAGQLRRIRTNGIDWVEVEAPAGAPSAFAVDPGPASSYMIIANEDAKLVDANGSDASYNYPDNPPPAGMTLFPKQNPDGTLVDEPNIDYKRWPLCIHRAPVNVNTASDKVLAALVMGINVQYGTTMAVGTDADLVTTWNYWNSSDPHNQEPYIIRPTGLKRLPAVALSAGLPTPVKTFYGKIVFDRPMPTADAQHFGYLNNFGNLDPGGTPSVNEANVLAYRIIVARQRDIDPGTGKPYALNVANPDPYTNMEKGPFKNWGDLYFRAIKPWDDARVNDSYDASVAAPAPQFHKESVARLVMAHFNPKTNLLKFNPNIEWIDRWGRNFTSMEPVMAYTNVPESTQTLQYFSTPASSSYPNPVYPDSITLTGHFNAPLADPVLNTSVPIFAQDIHSFPFGSAGNTNTATWSSFVLKANGPQYGAYVIRTFRYKVDEMIDKSDLNRSTTEFSFNSGGIYRIRSVGQVVQPQGNVLAERKVEAVVKVYDVWRESNQRQFVQGTISEGPAFNGGGLTPISSPATLGTTHSGQVTRDANTNTNRRPLVTLPEPLVPLNYKIVNNASILGGNSEVVDAAKTARDAWGNPKNIATPDVIANRILPANYDGQLMLATNTSNFDPTPSGEYDTFLASFNGDLDTDTCLGNGREQAKTPSNSKCRVVDTCGLLGILNDGEIDFDPGNMPAGQPNHPVYFFQTENTALQPLNSSNYWNSCTCRQGDLRTDGVYLSGAGISGKDATLKYLFGQNDPNDTFLVKEKVNFNPGSPLGNNISMWFKSTWHHDDNRNHEFFNATNPGCAHYGGWDAMYFYLAKAGKITQIASLGSDTGLPAVFQNPVGGSLQEDLFPGSTWSHKARDLDNDLIIPIGGDVGAGAEGGTSPLSPFNRHDPIHLRYGEFMAALHGGTSDTPFRDAPGPNGNPLPGIESPSFRVQPFRWQFTGARWNYSCTSQVLNPFPGGVGHSKKSITYQNPVVNEPRNYLAGSGNGFPLINAAAPYLPTKATPVPIGGNNVFNTGLGGTPASQIGPGDGNDLTNISHLVYRVRPFMDTQLDPEGALPASNTTWKPDGFYSACKVYTNYFVYANDPVVMVGDPIDWGRFGAQNSANPSGVQVGFNFPGTWSHYLKNNNAGYTYYGNDATGKTYKLTDTYPGPTVNAANWRTKEAVAPNKQSNQYTLDYNGGSTGFYINETYLPDLSYIPYYPSSPWTPSSNVPLPPPLAFPASYSSGAPIVTYPAPNAGAGVGGAYPPTPPMSVLPAGVIPVPGSAGLYINTNVLNTLTQQPAVFSFVKNKLVPPFNVAANLLTNIPPPAPFTSTWSTNLFGSTYNNSGIFTYNPVSFTVTGVTQPPAPVVIYQSALPAGPYPYFVCPFDYGAGPYEPTAAWYLADLTDFPRTGVRCDLGNSGEQIRTKLNDCLSGADFPTNMPKEVEATDKYKDLSLEYQNLIDGAAVAYSNPTMFNNTKIMPQPFTTGNKNGNNYDMSSNNLNRGLVVNVKVAQDVKWDWADPAGPNPLKCFGINNLNYDDQTYIGRFGPADGTYAVIDELKISSKDVMMTGTGSAPNATPDTNLFPPRRPYDPVSNPNSAPALSPNDNSLNGLIMKTMPAYIDAKGGAPMFGSLLNGTATDANLRARPWMATAAQWKQDRIAREQTLCRYYLPPDPGNPDQCPTFTSQTMLQSVKGVSTATSPESVIIARVTWDVFTPRFMSEYMYPGNVNSNFPSGHYQRYETITNGGTGNAANNWFPPARNCTLKSYKGPFEYKRYNDIYDSSDVTKNNLGTDYSDSTFDADRTVVPYRCSRPNPSQYAPGKLVANTYPNYYQNEYHATRGVEVELLQDGNATPLSGFENSTGTFKAASTFKDPIVYNRFGDPGSNTYVTVDPAKLRYRVRFRYPVDPLVDPDGGVVDADGWHWVGPNDPSKPNAQYLLDSPVFEAISVIYLVKPQILTYKEVTE